MAPRIEVSKTCRVSCVAPFKELNSFLNCFSKCHTGFCEYETNQGDSQSARYAFQKDQGKFQAFQCVYFCSIISTFPNELISMIITAEQLQWSGSDQNDELARFAHVRFINKKYVYCSVMIKSRIRSHWTIFKSFYNPFSF